MENEIREIISMRSLHTKAHTFASRTSPSTDQSLQKCVLFGNPKRNSIFFSHPSVFYFFATHNRHKNSWTETAKTYTEQDLTMTVDRRPACNSGFAKKRVQWLIEHSTSHQILWYVDSLVLRNPLLRKAANRYKQP
ncbi:hypothetical protein AEM51_11545 [Bacteroidetes bacterium UKL13-3]|nr:hypothetical protein AEM51_11545 [Bacteroidetes bacterium UKL13-3]